jgi:M6 family metalloprotease-like protein
MTSKLARETGRRYIRRTDRLITLCAALVASTVLTLQPPAARALERPVSRQVRVPTAAQLENARRLGNHLTSPQLVDRLNMQLRDITGNASGAQPSLPGPQPSPHPAPPGAPIPDNWTTLQSSGNPKVLALLISFQDYPADVEATTVQSMLFGDGDTANYPRESLRRYYERSSYGALSIRGDVLGWYAAGKRSTVVETDAGRENLIKQALSSYEAAGHDFAQYDNDNDGVIDYLIVMWTGPVGAWASFWWGYQTGWQDSAYKLDGKRFGSYSWQWEASTPTVVIHETGHALGLPDYYDYDDSIGPDGGLGGFDMMDANRGDHNCFSKFLLGWLTPSVIGGGSNTFSLEPSSLEPDCVMVVPGCTEDRDPFAEFYLVENRTRMSAGNDPSLPGDGVLVWHIDGQLNPSNGRFVNDNSYSSHKLIRVMEADGLEEIESGGSADAQDYWNSAQTFSSTSTPACSYYNGEPCPFEVTNMSAPGAPMTLDVSYGSLPPLLCNDWRYKELERLCILMGCNELKPGEDVINPPDLWIREQIERGTPYASKLTRIQEKAQSLAEIAKHASPAEAVALEAQASALLVEVNKLGASINAGKQKQFAR